MREVGEYLGLDEVITRRQPLSGSGLAMRVTGEASLEKLAIVRESDAILREEFAKAGLEGKVWQYFTAVPDFKSTGVRNGARCWEYPDRKSTRLNSSHPTTSRMPSSA